jgi:hypothetical protein
MPVRHLLKQLELKQLGDGRSGDHAGECAGERPTRDVRPPWLVELIERAAHLFDPHEDVARAGYDCRPTEDGWEEDPFLGSVDHVGGPADGSRSTAGFEFDLRPLEGLFSELASLSWQVPAASSDGSAVTGSVVRADGWIEQTPVRLSIHSTPPEIAGPGLRKFPDGRIGLA